MHSVSHSKVTELCNIKIIQFDYMIKHENYKGNKSNAHIYLKMLLQFYR